MQNTFKLIVSTFTIILLVNCHLVTSNGVSSNTTGSAGFQFGGNGGSVKYELSSYKIIGTVKIGFVTSQKDGFLLKISEPFSDGKFIMVYTISGNVYVTLKVNDFTVDDIFDTSIRVDDNAYHEVKFFHGHDFFLEIDDNGEINRTNTGRHSPIVGGQIEVGNSVQTVGNRPFHGNITKLVINELDIFNNEIPVKKVEINGDVKAIINEGNPSTSSKKLSTTPTVQSDDLIINGRTSDPICTFKINGKCARPIHPSDDLVTPSYVPSKRLPTKKINNKNNAFGDDCGDDEDCLDGSGSGSGSGEGPDDFYSPTPFIFATTTTTTTAKTSSAAVTSTEGISSTAASSSAPTYSTVAWSDTPTYSTAASSAIPTYSTSSPTSKVSKITDFYWVTPTVGEATSWYPIRKTDTKPLGYIPPTIATTEQSEVPDYNDTYPEELSTTFSTYVDYEITETEDYGFTEYPESDSFYFLSKELALMIGISIAILLTVIIILCVIFKRRSSKSKKAVV